MLFKLAKGAKKVCGSGKVALLFVENWFRQSERSCLCVQHCSPMVPEGGRAEARHRSRSPSPQLVPLPSGSIANWCRLEQPSGFWSAAFPSLNWLQNLSLCGSILRIGMYDKRGGDPGWFVIVWERLSLAWRVCIMSRINISLLEVWLDSRTTHLGRSKLSFYRNTERVFKVRSRSK